MMGLTAQVYKMHSPNLQFPFITVVEHDPLKNLPGRRIQLDRCRVTGTTFISKINVHRLTISRQDLPFHTHQFIRNSPLFQALQYLPFMQNLTKPSSTVRAKFLPVTLHDRSSF